MRSAARWALLFATTGAFALAAPAAEAASCGGFLQPKCPPKPVQCADGVDNDKDGSRDLADEGCTSTRDASEYEDKAPDANGLPRGFDVDPRKASAAFGFNSSLSLAEGTGVSTEKEADLIQWAGGRAQRMSVRWATIQPTANAPLAERMGGIDRVYQTLTARGMTLVLGVIDAPLWTTYLATCGWLDWKCQQARKNPPANMPPNNIGPYRDFIRWLALRYPRAAIETWNEPNIQRFWGGTPFPNVGRMATMQCEAYDAVHSTGPGRIVVAPGLSFIGPNPSAGQVPYVDYVEGMHLHMKRKCWDALSVHVYPSSHVDGDGSSTAFALRAIKRLRARFNDTSPIWITETGASTSGDQGGDHGHTERTPDEQGEMVRLAVNELLTTPEVGMVLVHTLRDRPTTTGSGSTEGSVQYGFGLLGEDMAPKPAFCHLINVVGAMPPDCPLPDPTALTAPTGTPTPIVTSAARSASSPSWLSSVLSLLGG